MHMYACGFWMMQSCMCNLTVTVASLFAKLTLFQTEESSLVNVMCRHNVVW